jgi:hypothetical protein
MTDGTWKNPWMLTAVGMILVAVAGFGTGLFLANWSGKRDKMAPRVALSTRVESVPTRGTVDACNQSAAIQAGQRENTKDTVVAGGGTLYGLNENKKHDERYRDAYAACMLSRGYMAWR